MFVCLGSEMAPLNILYQLCSRLVLSWKNYSGAAAAVSDSNLLPLQDLAKRILVEVRAHKLGIPQSIVDELRATATVELALQKEGGLIRVYMV